MNSPSQLAPHLHPCAWFEGVFWPYWGERHAASSTLSLSCRHKAAAYLCSSSRSFPRPTDLHTSSQNVTMFSRVLIELEWLTYVCMSIPRQRERENLNTITSHNTAPLLFLNPRNPPTLLALTCRGGRSVRFRTSELWKATTQSRSLIHLLKTECASSHSACQRERSTVCCTQGCSQGNVTWNLSSCFRNENNPCSQKINKKREPEEQEIQ